MEEKKILIFGGTTEGRKAVTVCEAAAKPFYYSTKGNIQQVEMVYGQALQGIMDRKQMAAFCTAHSIGLIIDAAHPFAEQLHENIASVSEEYTIPVIRLERIYPPREAGLRWFDGYPEIISQLHKEHITKPLFLTGVNTISLFKPYWQTHPSYFRILDREESRKIASQENFPSEYLLYYRPGEVNTTLLSTLQPEVIITKESGETGGFMEKVAAARSLDIPVWVICRPTLSPSFIVVNGEHGLRKEIQKLLPDFFALKTGYTTGTCATAATKAALLHLLTGEQLTEVSVTLPNGESIAIPIASVSAVSPQEARSSVIKYSGDDPDITNGLPVQSTVRILSGATGISFCGGEGVGKVTLPGIGLEVGEPAINRTPRAMMTREVEELLQRHADCLPEETPVSIEITIAVPGGEEIARKTFNPKLGIEGGISIIGTSGIVQPFSSEAFIQSIRREMEVARAIGCQHLVINSGAKSERLMKQLFPGFSPQAFIHYGNFIGETLQMAHDLAIPRLTMGIMIGKAVKLAEGALDTHSKQGSMNLSFLQEVAREAGATASQLEAIRHIHLARQLETIFPEASHPFYNLLIEKCYSHCRPLYPDGQLDIRLVKE